MSTVKLVRCACGLELRGTDEELIPAVQQHGRDLHNMEATAEQVLAMAIPLDQAIPLDHTVATDQTAPVAGLAGAGPDPS